MEYYQTIMNAIWEGHTPAKAEFLKDIYEDTNEAAKFFGWVMQQEFANAEARGDFLGTFFKLFDGVAVKWQLVEKLWNSDDLDIKKAVAIEIIPSADAAFNAEIISEGRMRDIWMEVATHPCQEICEMASFYIEILCESSFMSLPEKLQFLTDGLKSKSIIVMDVVPAISCIPDNIENNLEFCESLELILPLMFGANPQNDLHFSAFINGMQCRKLTDMDAMDRILRKVYGDEKTEAAYGLGRGASEWAAQGSKEYQKNAPPWQKHDFDL